MSSARRTCLVDSSTTDRALMAEHCCAASFSCQFGRRSRLICMLILTFSFFMAEIVVGYVTNSVALVADSFHMLSDAISLVVGLMAVIFSDKASKHNTYGWVRAEVLGAFFNAVFLLALCFNIFIEAIQRTVKVEEINNPLLVLGVGGAGLALNLVGLLLFHGHAHGHSHNHQHSGESDSQMNMRGVFLHVVGDALGSVVVIANSLAIYFVQGDWKYYLDPVMSLFISVIIVATTIPLLKQSALILLQNPPPHVKVNEIVDQIIKIPGVVSIHDLHIWQLSVGRVVASVHIITHLENDFGDTARQVSEVFHDSGIHSLTMQPEYCRDCVSEREDDSLLSQTLISEKIDWDLSKTDDNATKELSKRGVKPIHQSCLLSCSTQDCQRFRCCKQAHYKRDGGDDKNQSFC